MALLTIDALGFVAAERVGERQSNRGQERDILCYRVQAASLAY